MTKTLTREPELKKYGKVVHLFTIKFVLPWFYPTHYNPHFTFTFVRRTALQVNNDGATIFVEEMAFHQGVVLEMAIRVDLH